MAINPNGSANNFFDHRNKLIIENIQKVSVKDQLEKSQRQNSEVLHYYPLFSYYSSTMQVFAIFLKK